MPQRSLRSALEAMALAWFCGWAHRAKAPSCHLSQARRIAAWAVLALTLPASSATAEDEATAAKPLSQRTPVSFAEAFAPISEPSPITTPPGAVDLTTFAAPLEPQGPRVIRTLGTKVASYYGKRFHGRLTANGERFNMNAMTAAHKTLPFGTRVRVTNPANGRSVIVRINDRGPFIRGRAIDLSRAAARKIGMIQRGHARVALEIVAP